MDHEARLLLAVDELERQATDPRFINRLRKHAVRRYITAHQTYSHEEACIAADEAESNFFMVLLLIKQEFEYRLKHGLFPLNK